MKRIRVSLLALSLLCATGRSQILEYGAPSPAGFQAALSTAAQQSYAGNPYFVIRLEHPNTLGAVAFTSLGSAAVPIGNLTFLLDPVTLTTFTLPFPTGTHDYPAPLPRDPAIAGFPLFIQAAVIDTTISGSIGLSSGLEVAVKMRRTPIRGYFPGQDFSFGANAPGQISTMDLSLWPPFFRASGSVGFGGSISNNYPAAIAVSDRQDYAFALGHGTTNPFIRILDISAQESGAAVVYPLVGDMPLAQSASGSIGRNDLEVTGDGRWLFSTSGGNPTVLDVWDLSGLPATVPAAPAQSITLPNGSSSPATLEVSASGALLAIVLGGNSGRDLTIFDITAAAQPLVERSRFTFQGASASAEPASADFSPDGRYVFAAGQSGFSLVDLAAAPGAQILIDGQSWSPNPGGSSTLARHCGALAVQNGKMVGVIGEEGTSSNNQYALIDLEPTSATFGQVLSRFSTNPGGNISNHRIHALGNIVVAIDGSGATRDAQWVDVIDLDQLDPVTGFAAARVQTPSYTSLQPGGISSIPREFDLR